MTMITETFVQAGNAIFTVSSPSGERYTFRVRKVEKDDRPPITFASVMTGSDNETSYSYMGVVDFQAMNVRTTKASKFADDSTPVRVFRWALSLVGDFDRWMDAVERGYRIEQSGWCGRCARLLTVPQSIRAGIGAECAVAMGVDQATLARETEALWKEVTIPHAA